MTDGANITGFDDSFFIDKEHPRIELTIHEVRDVRDYKYYWLKLNKDFFNSKRIKKLRKRLLGSDTYTIIYLKMQLLSLTKDGYLEYTGFGKDVPQELALDIDEDPENVAVTVSYLLKCVAD